MVPKDFSSLYGSSTREQRAYLANRWETWIQLKSVSCIFFNNVLIGSLSSFTKNFIVEPVSAISQEASVSLWSHSSSLTEILLFQQKPFPGISLMVKSVPPGSEGPDTSQTRKGAESRSSTTCVSALRKCLIFLLYKRKATYSYLFCGAGPAVMHRNAKMLVGVLKNGVSGAWGQ